MKKILLSTTMLALFAGAASAEVTLSGSGRFGLDYAENRDAEVQLAYRLRINVDAKFEADNGVTYGGRIRFQNTNSTQVVDVSDGAAVIRNAAEFSPAYLYVEASGVRVEVGNSNTAIDSVALMYNPEIGFQESSFGDPEGNFYSFSSGPYGANRVGIYAAYSYSGVNLKASYIQADQTVDTGVNGSGADELSVAADFTTGQFTVAAAYADNGAGIEGNYVTFVGAAYAFSDVGNVGLNYNDNGEYGAWGKTITLYGNYTINGITLAGYVSDSDEEYIDEDGDLQDNDTAYGIGASYDLGGATLAGAIQSSFQGEMVGDLGVRMSF
ncbi:porin [Cypionkella sp.]|uniref:porin n=1 Tax=Cypionkella sp. TaxID=2811411 RepID=UPI00261CA010|nr:porin [Cypionkella sp.]MDB5665503.1 porin [Cypionkella sp.]